MRLYLVRHGQAKSEQVDPDRSLSDQGLWDVGKVAGFIGPLDIRVQEVWHSGKKRAEQTAEILSSALAEAPRLAAREGLSPNDPVAEVAEELSRRREDLMIVGHLPFLDRLACGLLAGNELAEMFVFGPAAMLCLARAEQGNWQVRWMIVPEVLSEAADA